MNKKRHICMASFLFIIMFILSIQSNASLCTLPVLGNGQNIFEDADTVGIAAYTDEIKQLDSLQSCSVVRTGLSAIKHGKRVQKSNQKIGLFFYDASLFFLMGFYLITLLSVIEETGHSMPFQRLLCYIHNKDGKK